MSLGLARLAAKLPHLFFPPSSNRTESKSHDPKPRGFQGRGLVESIHAVLICSGYVSSAATWDQGFGMMMRLDTILQD